MRKCLTFMVGIAIPFALAPAALAHAGARHTNQLRPGMRTFLRLSTGSQAGFDARRPSSTVQDALLNRPATIGALPRILVGRVPQAAAFDPATGTVYVANENDGTLSVVDTRGCGGGLVGGCGQTPPTVAAGNGPFAVAIDDATHTVYVADSNGDTVSVIDASKCNATDTTGCGQTPEIVPAGSGPAGLALDPTTHTLYVTDAGTNLDGSGHTVSVIDGATCNASDTAGCGQPVATVPVGNFPFFAAFDPAHQTVYVTDAADNAASMIDVRTCHAGLVAGCAQTPPTVAVGAFPIPVAIDGSTDTVYIGNAADNTVSVLNAGRCNTTDTTGCGHLPVTISVPGGPDGLAVDGAAGTLFVSNNGPGSSSSQADTVSVLDTATCNAHVTSSCAQRAPVALTGANPGQPAVDPATDTAYVPTFDNALAVLDGSTCRAGALTGCGQSAPETPVGNGPFGLAIDAVTGTAYVGVGGTSGGSPFAISVLAACRPDRAPECHPATAAIPLQFLPFGIAVDETTNTIYATDSFDSTGTNGDTVSVIDGSACDAEVTSGCGNAPASVRVGGGPGGLAIDRATHTVYVANNADDTLSVIDAATCNAATAAGCDETTATVPLGPSQNGPYAVAVNEKTDTVYVLNSGIPSLVSVLNGARCNARVRLGCTQQPPTVAVGNAFAFGALGLAVDQATNTVYVDNNGDDTVSVINGATCDGRVTSGCLQTSPIVQVGRQHDGFVAVDPTTHLVYVTNTLDENVSIIDGSSCNGTVSSGCRQVPRTVATNGWPIGVAIDADRHTVYTGEFGGNTLGFFDFETPKRPNKVTAIANGGGVDLAWQRALDGGLPIVYRVVPTPACGGCSGLSTPSTSGIPRSTVTGLVPGQRYTFRVTATDAAGTGPSSSPSNSITP